jgi:hypothetical protein
VTADSSSKVAALMWVMVIGIGPPRIMAAAPPRGSLSSDAQPTPFGAVTDQRRFRGLELIARRGRGSEDARDSVSEQHPLWEQQMNEYLDGEECTSGSSSTPFGNSSTLQARGAGCLVGDAGECLRRK